MKIKEVKYFSSKAKFSAQICREDGTVLKFKTRKAWDDFIESCDIIDGREATA